MFLYNHYWRVKNISFSDKLLYTVIPCWFAAFLMTDALFLIFCTGTSIMESNKHLNTPHSKSGRRTRWSRKRKASFGETAAGQKNIRNLISVLLKCTSLCLTKIICAASTPKKIKFESSEKVQNNPEGLESTKNTFASCSETSPLAKIDLG